RPQFEGGRTTKKWILPGSFSNQRRHDNGSLQRNTGFSPSLQYAARASRRPQPGSGSVCAGFLEVELMEKGIAITRDTFQKALKHKGLKIVFGADATAGGNGRNYEEFIVRVRDGGQDPMAAMVSVTSLAAEPLRLQDQIGSLAPGMQADI